MTAGRQPFLHDQVVLVSAPTMAICPPSGQLDGSGAGGLYTADRRVLSVLYVQVGGAEPEPIHHELDGANGARFVAVLRGVEAPTPDVVLRLERRRVIDDATAGQVLTETLTFANAGATSVDVTATVRLGCDFADVASVKDGAATPVPVATTRTADGFEVTSDDVPGWSVAVHATPVPSNTTPAADGTVDLGFPLQIPGRGSASIVLTVVPVAPSNARVVARPGRRDTVGRDHPAGGAPTARSRDGVLGPLLARSIDDLDRLVLSDPIVAADVFYAAGAPWYLTMFGRDSLWAAWLALPLGVELAASTLRVLARRQAIELDPSIAAEPSEVCRELPPAGAQFTMPGCGCRRSTTARSTRHRCGSGSCTGPGAGGCRATEVRRAAPAPRRRRRLAPRPRRRQRQRAPGIHRRVQPRPREPGMEAVGLRPTPRRDARDGADRALRSAGLRLRGGTGRGRPLRDVRGQRSRSRRRRNLRLGRLAAAFHEHFSVSDETGSYVAIALDGQKQPVATITSNPGHLLTSGLLSTEQIATVAARLTSPN